MLHLEMKLVELISGPLGSRGSRLRAFISCKIGPMTFSGLKIYQGTKGLFLSYPHDSSAVEDHRQLFYPITREFREGMEKAAINAYYLKLLEGTPQEELPLLLGGPKGIAAGLSLRGESQVDSGADSPRITEYRSHQNSNVVRMVLNNELQLANVYYRGEDVEAENVDFGGFETKIIEKARS
jgi:DNA-binding cell septation regulator SpoVG